MWQVSRESEGPNACKGLKSARPSQMLGKRELSSLSPGLGTEWPLRKDG